MASFGLGRAPARGSPARRGGADLFSTCERRTDALMIGIYLLRSFASTAHGNWHPLSRHRIVRRDVNYHSYALVSGGGRVTARDALADGPVPYIRKSSEFRPTGTEHCWPLVEYVKNARSIRQKSVP